MTVRNLKLFSATVTWAGVRHQMFIETMPGDETADIKRLAESVFQVSFGSLHALKVEDVKRIKNLPQNAEPIGKQVRRLKNCDWAWIA